MKIHANSGDNNPAKRPEVRKKISETVKKRWKEGVYKEGREKCKKLMQSEEKRKEMSKIMKNYYENPENRKKLCEKTKEAFDNNPNIAKKISDSLKKAYKEGKIVSPFKGRDTHGKNNPCYKDTKIEDLVNNLQNIVKYQGSVSTNEFRNNKHRNFGKTVMRRVLKENNITLSDLAKRANTKFVNKKRKIKWKVKEDLTYQILQYYYSKIERHKKHNNIGIPDFTTENIIYDAKSTLNDIKSEQIFRYETIGKPVKIIPFEMKGETDIPNSKIIPITDLINDLPNEKQKEFTEKRNEILEIDNKQKGLSDF